jgi:hypothetical protein
MRSEKPWLCVEGRGFDSRHLHPGVLAKCQAHCWRKAGGHRRQRWPPAFRCAPVPWGQHPAVCLAPSAYRHAQTTFAGDPRALQLVDRLSHDWPGDGDQLVAIVREAL